MTSEIHPDSITASTNPSKNLTTLRQTLTQLLHERDAFFPKRAAKNSAAVRQTMEQYITTLLNNREAAWQPDPAIIAQASILVEKVVFICRYLKCGPTLLGYLLDSHPEIVALPGDSHLVDFVQKKASVYNKVTKNSASSYQDPLQDWDTFWISRLINPTGQAPFWMLGEFYEPYRQFVHYLDYWLLNLPDDKRRPFLAIVLAFYCANPKRPKSPQLWVEKTPTNEAHVNFILQLFPEARFIHIVRDLRTNTASLKKLHQQRGWPWSIEQNAFNITAPMTKGLAQQRQLGTDRDHLLCYEDLIADTKSRSIFRDSNA